MLLSWKKEVDVTWLEHGHRGKLLSAVGSFGLKVNIGGNVQSSEGRISINQRENTYVTMVNIIRDSNLKIRRIGGNDND